MRCRNTHRQGGALEEHAFKILAEIMKLRRACCNTRLVMPDISLPSAKLSIAKSEFLSKSHSP
ncbi:MAG: hypothetical protein V2B19_09810 [Pseudomonadota bacterium]